MSTAFTDIIVAPIFAVGGDMIDLLLTTAQEKKLIQKKVGKCERHWDTILQENMAQWKEIQKLGECTIHNKRRILRFIKINIFPHKSNACPHLP